MIPTQQNPTLHSYAGEGNRPVDQQNWSRDATPWNKIILQQTGQI